MFKNLLTAATIGCSMLLVNTLVFAEKCHNCDFSDKRIIVKQNAASKPASKINQQSNTKAPELKPLSGPRKLKPLSPPKPLKPSSSQ